MQAVDRVGNVSKAIAVANPFFHDTPATVSPTAAPTAAPTRKPGSSGSSSGGSGDQVKAVGGDVSIRSKPNKTSTRLGVMKSGKKGTYLGKSSVDSRGVRWYNVTYNGQSVWISSRYAKLS